MQTKHLKEIKEVLKKPHIDTRASYHLKEPGEGKCSASETVSSAYVSQCPMLVFQHGQYLGLVKGYLQAVLREQKDCSD